ncbi:FliH/SctL family protein [Clostridium tagluense]|uniref:FliH/SctL family protein n=1 Tax=Clostridium tagluense TaxID=360422 RepID=UPI001C6E73C1|nr:flagellar assembly protein FliH [Clostridium tagluense]MBW9154949.1 flagellar assembly protein FliH [Clostridium tagluense]WLC64402.1 flagellar assembly protein FliH [Clostridium tagluense]
MRSSFNVIKNSRVINQGNKEINTQLSRSSDGEILEKNNETQMDNIASYENIASNIVENAQKESEKIISKAFVDAAEAKALAFKEGIEEGHKEGYENGYNEAIEEARQEAQKIRGDADSILVAAKAEYNGYLIEKEQHIKALVVSIAENILKREVVEKNALDEMIFNSLKAERNMKYYIIKSNSSHFNAIKEQIENWKGRLAFQGDIFVIEDDFLDDGTAVIEKDTGKSIVSTSYGIEKIIEIFQQEQIQI